eukprot:UN08548
MIKSQFPTLQKKKNLSIYTICSETFLPFYTKKFKIREKKKFTKQHQTQYYSQNYVLLLNRLCIITSNTCFGFSNSIFNFLLPRGYIGNRL